MKCMNGSKKLFCVTKTISSFRLSGRNDGKCAVDEIAGGEMVEEMTESSAAKAEEQSRSFESMLMARIHSCSDPVPFDIDEIRKDVVWVEVGFEFDLNSAEELLASAWINSMVQWGEQQLAHLPRCFHVWSKCNSVKVSPLLTSKLVVSSAASQAVQVGKAEPEPWQWDVRIAHMRLFVHPQASDIAPTQVVQPSPLKEKRMGDLRDFGQQKLEIISKVQQQQHQPADVKSCEDCESWPCWIAKITPPLANESSDCAVDGPNAASGWLGFVGVTTSSRVSWNGWNGDGIGTNLSFFSSSSSLWPRITLFLLRDFVNLELIVCDDFSRFSRNFFKSIFDSTIPGWPSISL